ncbi:MAG: hypothetical protein V3W24_06245 [Gemmatimonadota bacterium]
MRPFALRLAVCCICVPAWVQGGPGQARAQETTGSAGAAIGGAALGAASGAMLGVTASLIPCSKTLSQLPCARASTLSAGLIGLGSGTLVGAWDSGRLGSAAKGAAIGFGAGAAVGIVAKEVVRQYGWLDVLSFGAIGMAFGAQPEGAALGLGAGAFVGSVLWLAIPSYELPDLAAAGLIGMAAGGLAAWVVDAVEADTSGGSGVTIPFSFRI